MRSSYRFIAALAVLCLLLASIPATVVSAAETITHTGLSVDYRSAGGTNGLDCRTAMYFHTGLNDSLATNTQLRAVSGEGGMYYNGSLRSDFFLLKAAPSLYYVNCAVTPFELGDQVMIAGQFADSSHAYLVTFPTTVFEYQGISANGKGWWKVVDASAADFITLSDFGLSGTTVGNSSISGTYAEGIAGKEFIFNWDVKLSSTANQFNMIFYGSTAKNYWDGYRIGLRSDGTIVVHNIAGLTGYDSAGNAASSTILGAVSLASLGLDTTEPMKVSMKIDYIDFDNDGLKDDSRLCLKLNDTTAIAAATLVNALGVLGNSTLFYSEGNGTQTVSDYTVEVPLLTLPDFGIDYGTYGNTAASVSGTYNGSLLNKKFVTDLVTTSQDKATDATQLYYGATAKNNWNGFHIQLRGNGSIVIFNQMGSVTTYSAIYLKRECGVEADTVYRLELMLSLTDSDGDGSQDDIHLTVWINGAQYAGHDPSSNNVVNGLYTMGASMLIYGQANNTTTFSDPQIDSATDNISVTLNNGLLTVSGTGTVKPEDVAAVVTDKTAVTELVIEAGVTGVASKAFEGLTSLTSVHSGNTLLTVADDAFAGCASGITLRYAADKPYYGGLYSPDIHPYYSFKMVTIGSSYGEDVNTYIYKLAKSYYANLPDRAEGDSAYDEIVIAELYTGGGTLQQRVQAINGSPNASAYYEKWSDEGVSIPISPTGQLSAGLMRMALRDEYWDYVMLMQSAADSANAASFIASTSGNGVADIDVMIDFAKQNNRFGENSKFLWLQTWSYNYKLQDANYQTAVAAEKNMQAGIANAMQTVVQQRVDSGALDAIVPAGAAIENLKTSALNREDASFDHTVPTGTQTWNGGVYSNYFAIQRDTAHASCGLGRFTLGLTAFSYIAALTDEEIGELSVRCYPKSLAEYEIAEKELSYGAVGRYLLYDEYTADCALQAYSAAASAIADPYVSTATCMTGDINDDGKRNALDAVRFKRAAAGESSFIDPLSADSDLDNDRDDADLGTLRKSIL